MRQMPNGKKGGFLDRITSELFEDDDKAKAAPPSQPAPVAAPAPVIAPTVPYTFGTTSPTAPEPLDADALKAVNDGVFGGPKTHYIDFMHMYDALNHPSDVSAVVTAMKAMDDSITPAVISADIASHLARLDGVVKKAASDIDGAAQQLLGGADSTLAQLKTANDAAAAEIERHNKETADRNVQISQVIQKRASDEAAIAHAKARAETAEATVKQQLLAMQAAFSAMPASH
jgi:hypothetical protein